MLQTVPKNYTFEDYLNYRDDTDLNSELFRGELIQMPLASGLHAEILCLIYHILQTEIQRLKLDYVPRPGNVGVRTGMKTSRIPDLLVMTEIQRQRLRNLPSAVLEDAPLLVVEIVSPENPEEDYRYKRSEYAALGIPEYWIIDPQALKVSISTLVSGFYELLELTPENSLNSPTFPELKITIGQILNPDR